MDGATKPPTLTEDPKAKPRGIFDTRGEPKQRQTVLIGFASRWLQSTPCTDQSRVRDPAAPRPARGT
jgi:hypothetical protein